MTSQTEKDASALLVMDLQGAVVGGFPDPGPVVDRLTEALAHARRQNMLRIYTRLAFRAGYPEIRTSNKMFAALNGSGHFLDDSPETAIVEQVKPQDNEIIITKRRVGAFPATDLRDVLAANDIQTLVLGGISTSGVVLSTLRTAADLDYKITVLSDGCADRDDDVHRTLMERVFPAQATVSTVAEWIS
jgi:nicotinamidase-related amidase